MVEIAWARVKIWIRRSANQSKTAPHAFLFLVFLLFLSCRRLELILTHFFIVVISALDELKKYDSGAREATKFLEQELKKGNR